MKVCPNGVFHVLADGAVKPVDDDDFSGGFQIVGAADDLPNCRDGSRPKMQKTAPCPVD